MIKNKTAVKMTRNLEELQSVSEIILSSRYVGSRYSESSIELKRLFQQKTIYVKSQETYPYDFIRF